MDDSRNIKALKERKPSTEEENEVVEEETVEEEIETVEEEIEQTLDEIIPTDTNLDQSDYHNLPNDKEGLDKYMGYSSSSAISNISGSGEGEALEGESGAIEIYSDQSELSDTSAREREVPELQEPEEQFSGVNWEQTIDSKVKLMEGEVEQTSGGSEEMEEEADEEGEEEEEEEELSEELEIDPKFAEFENEVEEFLTNEYPDDPIQVEEMKLEVYENLIIELNKADKEIDDMLKEADKTDDKIELNEKALRLLIAYHKKLASTSQKIEDLASELFGGEEEEEVEEEDLEDEERSRGAEIAKEIFETDDIESAGSLGKESSDSENLSAMLDEMAADLKGSEAELENSGSKKKTKKQEKKGQEVRSLKSGTKKIMK